MLNRKLMVIMGLSLCCLAGCTSNNNESAAVDTQPSIEQSVDSTSSITEGVEIKLEESSDGVEITFDDSTVEVPETEMSEYAAENTLEEDLNNTTEENVVASFEASENSEEVISEVTDESVTDENTDLSTTYVNSTGEIKAIEEDRMLISVYNGSDTYANISDETVVEEGLAIGDTVIVRHTMIETMSLPGIWPQVSEISRLAQ